MKILILNSELQVNFWDLKGNLNPYCNQRFIIFKASANLSVNGVGLFRTQHLGRGGSGNTSIKIVGTTEFIAMTFLPYVGIHK